MPYLASLLHAMSSVEKLANIVPGIACSTSACNPSSKRHALTWHNTCNYTAPTYINQWDWLRIVMNEFQPVLGRYWLNGHRGCLCKHNAGISTCNYVLVDPYNTSTMKLNCLAEMYWTSTMQLVPMTNPIEIHWPSKNMRIGLNFSVSVELGISSLEINWDNL